MKFLKVYSVIAFSAMALVANATINAMADITIKSESGYGVDKITLIEATDGTAAYEDGKDSPKLMNSSNDYSINLYAVTSDNQQVSTVYSNSLEDLNLVFKRNKKGETNYTLSFKDVIGTIKLNVNGTVVTVTEGGTYGPFAVAADEINIVANPSAVVPQFCFVNEVLTVNGYAGKKLAILKADKSVLVAEFTLADTYEFDFSGAAYPAKSKYIIMFDGLSNADPAEMKEYVIDVKPEVTKVTP